MKTKVILAIALVMLIGSMVVSTANAYGLYCIPGIPCNFATTQDCQGWRDDYYASGINIRILTRDIANYDRLMATRQIDYKAYYDTTTLWYGYLAESRVHVAEAKYQLKLNRCK